MTAPNLFSPEEFNKLVSEISNEFIGIKQGDNYIIYSTRNDFSFPVGIYYPNAEHIQYMSFGTKDNPLVEYMMENSNFTPEQFRYVDSGNELSNVVRSEYGAGGFLLGIGIGAYFGYKSGLSMDKKENVFETEKELLAYARKKGKQIRANRQRKRAKKMSVGGFVLPPDIQEQFDEWIEDGNASKKQNGNWIEQTTQWRKEFTLPELKKFFLKEFVSQNPIDEIVSAKANQDIRVSYSPDLEIKKGENVKDINKVLELLESEDSWKYDYFDKYGNRIDDGGNYMNLGGKLEKIKRPIKVRFHLGAGKNFMTWRVEELDTKKVQFIDPEKNRLVMYDCILTNRPTTAKKIFSGEINKQPIAWIECSKIEVFNDTDVPIAIDQIRYNPRENIHWSNSSSKNIDGKVYDKLVTYGRSVFVQDGKKFYELGGLIMEKGHGMNFDSVGTEQFDSTQVNLKDGGGISNDSVSKQVKDKLKSLGREDMIPSFSLQDKLVLFFTGEETGYYGINLDDLLECDEEYEFLDKLSPLDTYKSGGKIPSSFKKAIENKEVVYFFNPEDEENVYMKRKSNGELFSGYMPSSSMYDDILQGNYTWVSPEMQYNVDEIRKEAGIMKEGGKVQTLAQDKFIKVMREFGKGELHHGTTGDVVSDRDMAVAIAFSEARTIDPNYGKKFFGGKVSGAIEYTIANEFGATTKFLISPMRDQKWRVQVEIMEHSSKYGKPIHKDNSDFWLNEKDMIALKKRILSLSPDIREY